MEDNLKQLETRIKRGENLNEIGKEIETILVQGRDEGQRAYCQYLLGMILSKQNRIEPAIDSIEKAINLDTDYAEAYFLLFKLFKSKQYFDQTLNCLENCVRLGYRAYYCKKMLVKLSYNSSNFINAINYLAEYLGSFRSERFWRLILVDCFRSLGLNYEANLEYKAMTDRYQVQASIRQKFEKSTDVTKTEYELNYLNNQTFFRKLGFDFMDFPILSLKVIRYIDKEYIYNNKSKRFVLELTQIIESDLVIDEDDTVIIYNTDNVKVFERLVKIYNKIDSDLYRKIIGSIPVYIVEEDLNNWQLIMQLFDFESLSLWQNLHFWIGINKEDLRMKLLDKSAPLPNINYGTGLDNINQLLLEVKATKDDDYLQKLDNLCTYYNSSQIASFEKVLIITSNRQKILSHYGNLLNSFLQKKGYNCVLVSEEAPYYKFTNYYDLNITNEFRPDLIIHMFGVQTKLETYRHLPVPFTSWLSFNHDFHLYSDCGFQYQNFILTGNPNMAQQFLNSGYNASQIDFVSLPITFTNDELVKEINPVNELGIFADLEDVDHNLSNLVEISSKMITTKLSFNKADLKELFKDIYFQLYTILNKNFVRPDVGVYDMMIDFVFSNRNLKFDFFSLRNFSLLVKSELENPIIKLLQTKWVINDLKECGLEIYGEGWEKDPSFKNYFKRKVDYLTDIDDFKQIVLRNKINLYISNRLKNESLMQPDLINGIAAGGFFLVNDVLIKEYGDEILKPFGGLLVTYGSREDLVEKVNYYLNHENERQELARALQDHILRNFTIEKVAETLLKGAKNVLNNNLN